MSIKPFNPRGGGTIVIANGVAAVTTVLHNQIDQYSFYNSSATAIAFIRVTMQPTAGDPVAAATATTDMPVPPGAQIRLTFGFGFKSLSSIASAADGNLYVTPGTGN